MKYEEFDFENADKYYDIRKSNRSIAFSEQKLEVSVNTDELQFNIKFTIDDQRKSEYVEEFLKFIEMPVDELESHTYCKMTEPSIFDEQGSVQYHTYLYDVQRQFQKLSMFCFDKDFYPDEFSQYTAAQRLMLFNEIYPERPFPQTLTQKFAFEHIKNNYLDTLSKHTIAMARRIGEQVYAKYSSEEVSDAMVLAKEHGDNSVIMKITNEFASPFEKDYGLDALTSLLPDVVGRGVEIVYLCSTVEDLLMLAFKEMLVANAKIKRCGYCGKYFIIKGNYNTQYCNRIPDGETFNCQTLASRKKYLEKTHSNDAVKLYSRYYKRFYARSKTGSMKPAAFKKWKYQAMLKRDECIDGQITFEEFKIWLDNSFEGK